MKNYFKIIILLLTIPFLSACGSSGYAITYDTSPKGVPVICNGVNKGYSPVTLYYDLDMKKNYAQTQRCYAQWSNTGRKQFSNKWNLKKFPNGVMQTLDVPLAKSSYSSSNSSSSSYGKANKQLHSASNSSSSSASRKKHYDKYLKPSSNSSSSLASSKKTSSDDTVENIVLLLSILGEAASSATENLPSPSFNSVTPSFNSNSSSNKNKYLTPSFNSNSSSGYKSSLGNTYQYDLSNPLDQMLYKADPLAQFRDLNNGQSEMDSNLGQFGGGFISNENNINIYDWD